MHKKMLSCQLFTHARYLKFENNDRHIVHFFFHPVFLLGLGECGVCGDRDSGEMDLEDLHGLKRPALQKLCKKFGIRANGKVFAGV